jgi:murein L,D-transpeptidase YcbB/YkuD
MQNMFIASGIDPNNPGNKEPIWPSHSKLQAEAVIVAYLHDTPFKSFFASTLPFDVF